VKNFDSDHTAAFT